MTFLLDSETFVFPSIISLNSKIRKNIILSTVLYGCDTWSRPEGPTSVEGVRAQFWRLYLKVRWSNRMMEKIHNEELHHSFSPPSIRVIKWRIVRWAGHVAHMGEMKNAFRILVGIPEGRGRLGDLGVDGKIIIYWSVWCLGKHRDNSTLEIYSVKMWIGPNRLKIGSIGAILNTVTNQSGKLLTSRATISFCRRTRLHIRGPFERFVDSPSYSESELCRGAVMICFSKYPPWQAVRFLQRSTHFSKTCCRPFAANLRRTVEQAVLTSWSLASELPFHGWKNAEMAWSEIWIVWLHRWVVGFLIHFFQAEHTLQSRNADASLRK
jgi:hypothetical protein